MHGKQDNQGDNHIKRDGGFSGIGKFVLSDAVPAYPCAFPTTDSVSTSSFLASGTKLSVTPSSSSISFPIPVSSVAETVSSSASILPNTTPLPSATSSDVAVSSSMVQTAGLSFGWLTGVLPAPNKDDHYLVEFSDSNDYQMLAYVDRFGRAFSTSESVSIPPAREPDLAFEKYAEQIESGVEIGCVAVRNAEGGQRQVAQYRCVRDCYTLFDSWYDFGSYGQNLSYDEAVARCYFAFVHRPKLCGQQVPTRGLDSLHALLRNEEPLAALCGIVREVHAAERDQVLCPPALARCLAGWLEEAGLREILAIVASDSDGTDCIATDSVDSFENPSNEPLRLVKTARYAHTFFLGLEDADAHIPAHLLWGLEAALNRFLLISDTFGENASLATDADCGRWDAYLIETIALQASDTFFSTSDSSSILAADAHDLAADSLNDADSLNNAATSEASVVVNATPSEWTLRLCIGRTLERLRLPIRFHTDFRADVQSGVVAFCMVAPDAELMPRWRWDNLAGLWVSTTENERLTQALRYAEHLGIALAASAFYGSSAITRVMVTAFPLSRDGEKLDATRGMLAEEDTDSEFPEECLPFYQVSFARELFCRDNVYCQAANTDPAWFFALCGTAFGQEAAQINPFVLMEQGRVTKLRRDLPEVGLEQLTAAQQTALGAHTTYDLRISYDAMLRRVGARLAELVVRSESATKAIKVLRTTQEEADDPLVFEACTRLMTALAEGSVDSGDQNAVVACFLGDDVYATALEHARAMAAYDPAGAAALLAEVITDAEKSMRFVDNTETVHRMFDTYTSRVMYNISGADVGRRVELIPATLVFCYLESVRLLEESFAHVDTALRYGIRCIEMAPTFSAVYRQTARAYMLVGDLENAADTLVRGLHVALQPEEVATAYYQLAYVEWKAGRLNSGVACYLKSIMTSSVYAAQATIELQELLHEKDAHMIAREQIDEVLASANIPAVPLQSVLDELDEALHAAVDANLFAVARSILAVRLHYQPDDALVNVLRSLEVSPD